MLTFQTSALHMLRVTALITAALAVTAGCNIGSKIGNGISNFGHDLANPELVTVGGPGVQVVKGSYSSPIVDPWDDNGPVIVAFEFKDNVPYLAMRPLTGKGGCDTGVAYSSIVRDKLDNLTQLIAYEEAGDADGYGTVHFVDHQCNTYGHAIDNARLPNALYKDPPGYLMEARNTLMVYAPWTDKTTTLSSNVSWWEKWPSQDGAVALIDSGQLKVFDPQQNQIADIGTAVTQVMAISASSGSFALIDGGALRTYQSLSDPAPVDIASNACEASLDSTGCLFYYSPCDARTLQCYRAAQQTTTTVDTNVQSLVSSRSSTADGRIAVLYTKPNAQDGTPDLWMFTTNASPQLMLNKFSRLYSWSPPSEEIDALVNADSDIGQVVRRTTSDNTVVSDKVSVNFAQGLLANFDVQNSIGDLYSPIQLNTTPVKVASGVPYVPRLDTIVTSSNPDTQSYGRALVTNATGIVGDLSLLEYPPADPANLKSPQVVATQVAVQHYKFFSYMSALAYVDQWDSQQQGVGSLSLLQLDIDATSVISDQVSEYQEIGWPWVGVMYVVPSGDRAGIWVARAK